jgi:hypothetical protein
MHTLLLKIRTGPLPWNHLMISGLTSALAARLGRDILSKRAYSVNPYSGVVTQAVTPTCFRCPHLFTVGDQMST